MSTIGVELVKVLAVLSQGRNPGWTIQAEATAEPATIVAGVNVLEAVVAQLLVACRRDPAAHTSRVTVDTVDLTVTTYTITINGTAVAYDASVESPADQAALVNGIADAINADGTVGPLVTATVTDANGDNTIDTIVLTNNTGAATTHTTAVSVTGYGALSFTEDYTGISFRLWGLPNTSNDTSLALALPWVLINSGDFTIDYRGFVERIECAGFSRIFLEAYATTAPSGGTEGEGIFVVGPGELES